MNDEPPVMTGASVDIDTETAIAILTEAPIRVSYQSCAHWGGRGTYTDPQIRHRGVWKNLCRTDLCDDVATSVVANRDAEEWRRHYLWKLRRCQMGARVTDRRFSIIDAVSDG